MGKPFLFARNFELKFVDNFSRNLALGRQQVGHLTVVLLTPEQLVVTDVHQFGADRKIVATLYDSSQEHRTYAKLIACIYGVSLFALIAEGQTGRGYSQVRQLRQPVNERFSQAVGKILRFRVDAAI